MLWIPLIGVVVALVFERKAATFYMRLAAGLLALIMLSLLDVVPLDSSISPVVAVLNSTLWLTIHVLVIVASYGALALGAVLAHFHAVLSVTRGTAYPAVVTIDHALYRVLQVGIILTLVPHSVAPPELILLD